MTTEKPTQEIPPISADTTTLVEPPQVVIDMEKSSPIPDRFIQ